MAKTWQDRPVHRAMAVVAAQYGISRKWLVNTGRTHRAQVRPRQLVMWLAVQLGAGIAQTGRIVGLRHTTVLYTVRVVEKRRAANDAFRSHCDALLDMARDFRVSIAPPKVAPPERRREIVRREPVTRRRWDTDIERSFGL